MTPLELSKLARPVEFFIRGNETPIISLHAAIDGPFLLLLNCKGEELSRYNMTSNVFNNLNWLDRAKVDILDSKNQKVLEEIKEIQALSPRYRHLYFFFIGTKKYLRKDCCQKCDLHGELLEETNWLPVRAALRGILLAQSVTIQGIRILKRMKPAMVPSAHFTRASLTTNI